jgi:hypothetical protein
VEEIEMTDKPLRSVSVFVSPQKNISSNETELITHDVYERVYILALAIRQANRIFSAPYYIVFCGLSGCTFFHFIS